MTNKVYQAPTFDFTRAISQLFSQPGGRNFTIRLVLWTSALMAAVFALFAAPFFGFMGAVLESSWQASQNSENPEVVLGEYQAMLGFVLPMMGALIVMWAVYASAETALHKRILRNEDSGFIPLRFGPDEMRVMAAQFLVILVLLGVMLVYGLALGVLAVAIGLLAQLASVFAILLALLIFVGYIGLIWAWIYVSIRLAPAAALSTQSGSLKVTGGWKITKKRAGNLFLAYLLLYIVGYVVITIIQVAGLSSILDENYMLVMMGMSEENPSDLFAAAAETLKQPSTMAIIIFSGILYLIVTMCWYLSMSGVAAYAVQWWDETNEESVFD